MRSRAPKALSLFLVFAVVSVALFACSSKVSGRYDFVAIEIDGVEYSDDMFGYAGLDDVEMYIEFSGNSCRLYGFGTTEEYVFTQNGKALTIKVEGQEGQEREIPATVDRNRVSIEFVKGTRLVFERK